jgi:DNA-binding CsgD family transcriptional regulator
MPLISDPRGTKHEPTAAALAAWDMVHSSIDAAYATASQLRESLTATTEHQAYGWATATCGRVEAYRGKFVAAQELLAEAFGRLFLADDKYGQALVAACLAIPVSQTDVSRGIQLINSALTADFDFNVADRASLHGIAASCYFSRHDFHQALIHLNELVTWEGVRGDDKAIAKALSNLSITVFQLGESELARDSLLRALRAAGPSLPRTIARNWRAQMVSIYCRLEDLNHAGSLAAEVLTDISDPTDQHWTMYDNLAEGFARTRQVALAIVCLQRARECAPRPVAPIVQFALDATESLILESQGRFEHAIALSKSLLDSTPRLAYPATTRELARVLARCHRALGNVAAARKWEQRVRDEYHSGLIGRMLTNQIRSRLKTDATIQQLTEQELNCLRLSARGQSSTDIGLKLGITPRTVNFHFSKILKKLNALNRQEAIAKAATANLLSHQ